jgi:hypothetical protein
MEDANCQWQRENLFCIFIHRIHGSLEFNMKKPGLLFVITLLLAGLYGCARNPSASESPAPAANSNASGASGAAQPPKAEENQPAKPAESNIPPQALLQGTYAISEVQHDGIVEMITAANTTEITFKAPSAFYRFSKKDGKIDYKDNGQFKIEGKDSLVLSILMSNDKMQLKPVSKRFTFSISPTGDELKLTSASGGTAVFRRIKNN